MATVVANVFGDFEVALGKKNNVAVAVAAVDKVVNNSVLIALTDQVIKDNNFLIIWGELFKRKNLKVTLNNFVTDVRINALTKIF